MWSPRGQCEGDKYEMFLPFYEHEQNRDPGCSNSTLSGDNLHTAFTYTKANSILHVNLLQIIIDSFLLLKSKLLDKNKLCKMQSNLIRGYKTLLYKKHTVAPLNHIKY